jgi:hypothetical protein
MDEEPHPGIGRGGPVLEELIVSRSAPEAGGEDFLERLDQIGVGEAHAAGRELLEASQRVQVRRPPEALEGTATAPGSEDSPVPERYVQQDHRCGGAKGGHGE